MAEFITPKFLENQSVEEIFSEMKGVMPDDIDVSNAGHFHNMTYPTAYEISQMIQFRLLEAIKLILPRFCGEYDTMADYHAESRGMTRRKAKYSTGYLTIYGEEGTVIPEGSTFSTISVNDEPSIEFETTGAANIPAGGSIEVPIACLIGGTYGNVAANTIVLNRSNIDGITNVINVNPTEGGTDGETTEELLARIDEYDKNQGESFVGNKADYRRWVLEYPDEKISSVEVITPDEYAQGGADNEEYPQEEVTNGDGVLPIKIYITDSKGKRASSELCQGVYNYIMNPENPYERKAGINAYIQVLPPEVDSYITVIATIQLKDQYTLAAVKETVLATIQSYLTNEAVSDGEIKISRIGAILSQTEGIEDYTELYIGTDENIPSKENIPIKTSIIPLITDGSLILTTSEDVDDIESDIERLDNRLKGE